jgi:hypothetical protein
MVQRRNNRLKNQSKKAQPKKAETLKRKVPFSSYLQEETIESKQDKEYPQHCSTSHRKGHLKNNQFSLSEVIRMQEEPISISTKNSFKPYLKH